MSKINLLISQSLSVGYLSLGLLVAIESPVYAYEEESVSNEIITDVEEAKAEQTEQEIDQELFEIFHKFFDEKDTTSFSKIVTKVIVILKLKKTTLQGTQQSKCDELIKLLEKNKHNYNIVTWADILRNPNLQELMSEKSRVYINSISNMKKLQTLIYKLKNNSHTFF